MPKLIFGWTWTASAVLLTGATALQGLGATQKKSDAPPVPIIASVRPDMFPREWRVKPIYAKAIPIEQSQVGRSMRKAKEAMRKYPVSFLKRNLRRVFLVRSMTFYGVPYGGTNSLDAVYLCNDGEALGFTDYYLEQSFHHEFSSILLRNNPDKFSQAKWLAANPKGFRYLSDGTTAVREGLASIRYSAALYSKGFLTQYSQSNIEEDFNTIAEGLFMGNAAYWRAIDQNPSLRIKCKVAIDFYRKLDKTFSERLIRSFVKLDERK